MLSSRRRFLVALLSWTLLAAGCPGGEDPDPGNTTPANNTTSHDMAKTADMGGGDMPAEDMADTAKDMRDAIEDMEQVPDMTAPPVDMADAAPRLSEASCEIGNPPARSVKPGSDLLRVTLEAPLAVCNDGSPGVFYIKPGSGSGADKWLIWLEGGGGCTSGESCARRWCGRNIPSTAAKMSSKWAPDGIEGAGVFDSPAGATNDFANWNHVVAYYCSSDSWAGRIEHPRLSDPTGTVEDFSLVLHGKHILTAMLDVLDEGARSDSGAMQMPPLTEASMVLFSGTSAGGGGARLNADDVRERLLSNNPNVDFRLVVDAGVWTKEPSEDFSEEASQAFFDNSYAISSNFRNLFTDASCLAYHTRDPEKCSEPTHILLEHTETPFFIKMDYSDRVDSPGVYADNETFTRSTYALLQSIAAGDFSPEEASARQAGGVFAPNCGHHVALESGEFYNIKISDGAASASFHDVLSNWARGAEPTFVLDDREDVFSSVCR